MNKGKLADAKFLETLRVRLVELGNRPTTLEMRRLKYIIYKMTQEAYREEG